MEREDPLQRLERKEAEKKSNSGLKTVMIIMTVLAVILAGVLACLDVQQDLGKPAYP